MPFRRNAGIIPYGIFARALLARWQEQAVSNIFFDSWEGIIRILVVGVLSYASLIAMLRISGKRTLSKMSAFDFIITIALGSTLSSVILDKNIALAEGMLALALLIALQMAAACLSVRYKWARKLLHSEPTLLAYRGEYCVKAMRDARVTCAEIQQALRAHSIETLGQVESVVLETNGQLSVIQRKKR